MTDNDKISKPGSLIMGLICGIIMMFFENVGANGVDREVAALVAGRGAAGLVKSGKPINGTNNYALAA